ncbi:MAG TPA: hypothetical protein VEX86_01080 [Longimicrobium sp.]|nr:hypothetical protein [Longimicrobium sp.]
MNKLRLDVDQLKIDSFPTAREGDTPSYAITQGAQTCYHCTRFGCPQTELCM